MLPCMTYEQREEIIMRLHEMWLYLFDSENALVDSLGSQRRFDELCSCGLIVHERNNHSNTSLYWLVSPFPSNVYDTIDDCFLCVHVYQVDGALKHTTVQNNTYRSGDVYIATVLNIARHFMIDNFKSVHVFEIKQELIEECLLHLHRMYGVDDVVIREAPHEGHVLIFLNIMFTIPTKVIMLAECVVHNITAMDGTIQQLVLKSRYDSGTTLADGRFNIDAYGNDNFIPENVCRINKASHLK